MPIFWRLLIGYSAILLLSVGLSAYSIVQLGGLSTTARAALESDTRRIATVEILTDAFLSEVRYAGRYIITHTKDLYEQYRQFNSDFGRYMKDLQALATSPEIRTRLTRIADLHSRYNDLFDREVKYVQSAQPYGESRYKQEKEKVLESALRELELLKSHSQKNLQTKLKEMEREAATGRTLAIATTLVLVGFGFALCCKISKSITAPLLELQSNAAAADVCEDSAADYSRIPEIQDLSETLHRAKDHLRAAHASNAAFVHKISTEFTTPLVSLKNRLSYLKSTLGESATAEQRTTLLVLADETDRLIKRCAHLQVPTPPAITHTQAQNGSRPRGGLAAEASLPQRALSVLARMARGIVHSSKAGDYAKDGNHEESKM
jgi:CHASE3 domain sensor protein